MIFWIVVGLAVLITAIVVIVEARSYYGQPLEVLAGATVIVAVVTVLSAIVLSVIQADHGERFEESERSNLTAIATNDKKEGAYFFLGTGVSGTKKVYSFISEDADGGNRMEEVPVSKGVVYEGEEKPYMEVVTEYGNSWWITPWAVPRSGTEYRFHIPEGSIIRGYEVKP